MYVIKKDPNFTNALIIEHLQSIYIRWIDIKVTTNAKAKTIDLFLLSLEWEWSVTLNRASRHHYWFIILMKDFFHCIKVAFIYYITQLAKEVKNYNAFMSWSKDPIVVKECEFWLWNNYSKCILVWNKILDSFW